MESTLFLQYLRGHSLEEGRAYIQAQYAKLSDHAALGALMKDEAQRIEQTAPLDALKMAELLIFFGDVTHHLPSHALGLIAKGNALKTIGYHQVALSCLDDAGEEFLRVGDEVGWARSRIAWIISASWTGRMEEALQQAAAAREVFRQHGHYYWNCVIDHNIAVIQTQRGHYHEAIDIYERMLATYPTLRNQSEQQIAHHIAMAQVNQSRCLALIGNFKQAYRLQMQAQESFLALDAMFQVANTEFNLAEFDYAQGYYGSALQHYYRARDSLKQQRADDTLLHVLFELHMADCLVKLNRTEEAGQLAAQALERSQQLGASLEAVDVIRRYATILRVSGRLQEAVAALNDAEERFAQGNFEHHTSAARLQRAEIVLEMGAFSEAYEAALQVKVFFDHNGLIERSARAALVMAGALIERIARAQVPQEQRPALLEQVAQLCNQAIAQARQHNLQEQVYTCQLLQGRLADLEGNTEQAARHYIAAIAQVERILNDLAHDLSPAFLHTVWAVYEDLIALYLRQGKIEAALGFLERGRSLVLRQYLARLRTGPDRAPEAEALRTNVDAHEKSVVTLRLQRELEECQQTYRRYSKQLATLDAPLAPAADKASIEAELKRYEARLSELFERLHLQTSNHSEVSNGQRGARVYSKRNAVVAIDIGQILQRIEPGQVLLVYFLYRGRLVIFAATGERLVTHEQVDGAEQIEYLLPLLHAHLQPGGWPDQRRPPLRAVQRLLQKLYTLLIAPVAELLPPPSGTLTIVPYGPLHHLPFHALHNGRRFLIEDFQIHYLAAASMLPHIDVDCCRAEELKQREESVGAPLVMGYSAKRDLPRALEEAKTLAALLNGNCYLDEAATIDRLIAQAPGSPIIHLATHGQSRLDAPNFSAVLLADGPLNALDAFGLDLKFCQLVTLSGCETGLALSGGGDEQLGLGRAFLAAGASSLLMSLWPVEDSSTNILMQRFYERLLKGDNKAQALRLAQCSFLHDDALDAQLYTHPYFWSAFRLVGDVRPLLLRALASSIPLGADTEC